MNLLVNHKNDEECFCKYLYDFLLDKSQKFTSQHLLSNKICMKSMKKRNFYFSANENTHNFVVLFIVCCRVLLHFSVVNVCSCSCSYLQKCTTIFKAKRARPRWNVYKCTKSFQHRKFSSRNYRLKTFSFPFVFAL